MTSDDVCLWLEQNGIPKKDVQKFKGKHVLISRGLNAIKILVYIPWLGTQIFSLFM